MPRRSRPEATAPAVPAAAAGLAAGAADRLLRRLEWTVVRRLDGLLQGEYRTLMRGAGVDLADLREYQPHDDVRHIDWNVTARLGTPHVRVFSEDREMNAWFLLDLSPSVDFGPPGASKRDQLIGFVAVLARLLTRHGNRVGALLLGGASSPASSSAATVLPPRTGRTQVLRLIDALAPAAHAAGASGAPPGTTELHRLLGAAACALRRRSAVFVVSDFLSAPGWEKPLAHLAQRHDVVAVRLLDPLELELPDVGVLHLRDPETGEHLTVDTRDRSFRQRFARLAADREAALRTALARAGADTLELATDDDLLGALVRFMELRGQPVRARRRAPLVPPPRTAAAPEARAHA